MLELVLAVVACPQSSDARREELPDGTVALVHGEYKGKNRDGTWRWYYENKEIRARGKFKRGLPDGKWAFYYPGKQERAEGSYKRGLPEGAWDFWAPSGERDEVESGKYECRASEYSDGAPRRSTTFVDGCPSGPWRFWWPNGALQLSAGFKRSEKAGTWQLHHVDGSRDDQMLSGAYGPPSRMAQIQDEFELLAGDKERALNASGEPLVLSSLIAEDFADARSGVAARVDELQHVDFSTDEGYARGLNASVELARLCNGRSFGWSEATNPSAVAYNQLAARRWFTFMWLTADQEEFWMMDMALPAAPGGPQPPTELIQPRLSGERCAVAAASAGAFASRFKSGGGRDKKRNQKDPLQLALRWLVDHQASDGRWDADGFMENCAVCPSEADGPGEKDKDVGVTGLALLALLGDGNTTDSGPHADSVRRGVRWLLGQQDKNGLFGQHRGHHFIYGHGIATSALAEATCFSSSPMMDAALQKAVDYIHAARGPDGDDGWRYDVPSLGDTDTSITGWMIVALKAAEKAGVKIELEATLAALAWVDAVTDAKTGRVGYNNLGGRSSRVTGLNSDYPVSETEAMTAVGLQTRVLLGQRPEETPGMIKHANLLLKALPEFTMEGDQLLVDWYYWYHGTYAMYQMGGKYWKAWKKALDRAITKSQRKDGNFKGSWDIDGPWAYSGGRIYTTALGALCLEAEFRYPRMLE